MARRQESAQGIPLWSAGGGTGGRPDDRVEVSVSTADKTADVEALRTEHAAVTQEDHVLRLKLEHSEREHESTWREPEITRCGLERAEIEVGHLRGLTTQQADTI